MKTLAVVALCCLSSVSWGQVSGRPTYRTRVRTAEVTGESVEAIAKEMGEAQLEAWNTILHIDAEAHAIERDLIRGGMQRTAPRVVLFSHMDLSPAPVQQVQYELDAVRGDVGQIVVGGQNPGYVGLLNAPPPGPNPFDPIENPFWFKLWQSYHVDEQQVVSWAAAELIKTQGAKAQETIKFLIEEQGQATNSSLVSKWRELYWPTLETELTRFQSYLEKPTQ
jgi:hypothetical protein